MIASKKYYVDCEERAYTLSMECIPNNATWQSSLSSRDSRHQIEDCHVAWPDMNFVESAQTRSSQSSQYFFAVGKEINQ